MRFNFLNLFFKYNITSTSASKYAPTLPPDMTYQQKELPLPMNSAVCMVDPDNDKNHLIFGYIDDNGLSVCDCWKYDYTKQKYIRLKYQFELSPYHLLISVVFGIHCNYKFPKNSYNLDDIQHDPRKPKNDLSMQLMITDVFEKNKIHFAKLQNHNYEIFTFNDTAREMSTHSLTNDSVGPRLPSNNVFLKRNLFFFNISGNRDPKQVVLIATTLNKHNYSIEMLHLNKNNNCWENNFTNHHKLIFPENTFFSYGCDFMVKYLFCLFEMYTKQHTNKKNNH